ncbi:MAG: UrcA family protein [Sphingomonadales bacterium]|nr:MAG: UrcA family protein [Sphingomonadales bacterium]
MRPRIDRQTRRPEEKKMYKIMLPLVAALAAMPAMPAMAGERSVQVKVRHADLDLGTPAGRAMLDRRIAAATETVCGSYAGVSAEESFAIDDCRARAKADVRRQLAAIGGTRVAVR